MTVTVSPMGAAHLISDPSTFPRFLGRFAGTAPAQVAPLDFPIGPNPTDPNSVVVVYEGQVDINAERRVFARIVSSKGALGPEILVENGAESASVASMTYEHPGFRDFFAVVFRKSEHILARLFKNDGSAMGLAIKIADGGYFDFSKGFFRGLFGYTFNVGPSIAINSYWDAGPRFTVVWGCGFR
jgi:hypothetical protein